MAKLRRNSAVGLGVQGALADRVYMSVNTNE